MKTSLFSLFHPFLSLERALALLTNRSRLSSSAPEGSYRVCFSAATDEDSQENQEGDEAQNGVQMYHMFEVLPKTEPAAAPSQGAHR